MTFHPLSASEFVERALSMRGPVLEHGVGTYYLSAGAAWTAANCYADDGHNLKPGCCDCSGFLAWSGKWADPGRGPWNTDALVDDAIERVHLVPTGRPGPRTRVRLVEHDEAVRAGDLLVKPGPDLDHDGVRDRPGHCAVITRVLEGFVRGSLDWYDYLEATHCSGAKQLHVDPATGKPYGAIRTTNAAIWALDGYILRPLHVMP